MKITPEIVQKTAHLARLELDKTAEAKMTSDMIAITDWMDKLNEVNTDQVQPLIHMSEEMNVMRVDQVANVLPHEDGLKNAPKRDSDYFRVPKVIE